MAGQNNVCPGCNGRRLLMNGQGQPVTCPLCEGTGRAEPNYIYMPRWYLLSASGITLGALAVARGALSIDAIADFQALWMVATREGTFTTELVDQSGRAWQNAAVNDANMWGTAERPFPLVAALVIKAKAVLNWIFTDTSGNENVIQPCLIGFDLYPG